MRRTNSPCARTIRHDRRCICQAIGRTQTSPGARPVVDCKNEMPAGPCARNSREILKRVLKYSPATTNLSTSFKNKTPPFCELKFEGSLFLSVSAGDSAFPQSASNLLPKILVFLSRNANNSVALISFKQGYANFIRFEKIRVNRCVHYTFLSL